MGLDLGALKKVQEDLNTRGGGDSIFFNAKEIGEETDFRVLPPTAKMNGIYFLEVIVWWVNKKKIISPATFGDYDPIEEEVNEARESEDEDLLELVDDKEKCARKSEFWVPILLLDCKFKNGELVSAKVVDEKAKVLNCGQMLLKAINKVLSSRKAQNGTDDGATDRELGYNLIASKTGKGLKTEYSAALGEQLEMDSKYYKDTPDVIKMAQDAIKSEDYMRGVIRNYLYGEDMPEDESKDKKKTSSSKSKATSSRKRDEEEEEEDETPVRGRGSSSKTTASKSTSKRKIEVEDEEEEEEERPAKKADKPSGRRNLLKDLGNLDD